MSYMDVFHPRVEARKSIQISYVPVLLNPYEHYKTSKMSGYSGEDRIWRQSEEYKFREQIKGSFIMRIKVESVNPGLWFYWNENSNAKID